MENNNNGQQILDVLCQTHNYENVVSYYYDGFSKHYNNTHRYGIHNHTNTKYKGVTNFRYWINSLKAVKINDIDTLLEINNFIRLPNYTYSKRSDSDLDDRVFGMIWALFILDPSIVSKYFIIQDVDDQGRPMKIYPQTENKELIKASPLLLGEGSKFSRKPTQSFPYTNVGGSDGFNPFGEEEQDLYKWLLGAEMTNEDIQNPPEGEKNQQIDNYSPIVLF